VNKQDAHDKSRDLTIPPSIPVQERRFSRRQRTFVAGVKQSQFQPNESKGKCLVEKDLWWIGHVPGRSKTKPILGGAGWDGARRTRAVVCPLDLRLGGVRRANCAKQSQTWADGGVWGTMSPSRQTKPISSVRKKPVGQAPPSVHDVGRGRPTYGEPIVQNKPNLPLSVYPSVPSFQHSHPVPIVRNEANSPCIHATQGKGAGRMKRTIEELRF
jgi:hypothetical protein